MQVDPTIWVAAATVLAAIAAGYFSQRAAGRTAQPSAQDAINAGFTALTARQVEELTRLRRDVTELQATNRDQAKRIQDLEDHVEQQDDREHRYQRALRKLLDHLQKLRQLLIDAELTPPSDPVDLAEISALLDKPT